MTPGNYIAVGAFFIPAAILAVDYAVQRIFNRPAKQPVLLLPRYPVDTAVDNRAKYTPSAPQAAERMNETRAHCNAPVAAPGGLGANRPPDVTQGAPSASAVAGGEGGTASTTPTCLEALRSAAAYICKYSNHLDPVTRLALLASVGGKSCVTAYYERGL